MFGDNIPEEAFEMTWRDGVQILRDAGTESAFVLLVARDIGVEYLTRFVISTGTDRIRASDLKTLLDNWFDGGDFEV